MVAKETEVFKMAKRPRFNCYRDAAIFVFEEIDQVRGYKYFETVCSMILLKELFVRQGSCTRENYHLQGSWIR